MDGYLEQALLDDSEAFHPYENVYGIELWRSTKRDKPVFRHGDVSHDQYSDWLQQRGRYVEAIDRADGDVVGCLRILACKSTEALRNWGHTGVRGTGANALSMSRDEYEQALDRMRLPKTLLTVMSRQTAAWMRTKEGFVLKTNSARTMHFGMACSQPTATGDVNVLLLGLEPDQVTEVCQCLENEDMSLPLSALLPIILIELRAGATLQHISHSHTNIFYLEGETGVFAGTQRTGTQREVGYRLSASGAKIRPQVRKSVDYERVTVELTSTITELSHALFTCDVNNRMLNDLHYLIRAPSPSPPTTESHTDQYTTLSDKIAYLKTYYAGLSSRTQYVLRRAEAQVQTIYSLVAQRDSAASTALAAASREDNILMRKIAEDSKRVAVATSRDSASMKIIAGVTILFLPATSVATLFSTSFFSFGQEGKVVSWWLWLYWVVTAVLTVVIHGFWWMFSRSKEREIEQKFGETASRDELEIEVQGTK